MSKNKNYKKNSHINSMNSRHQTKNENLAHRNQLDTLDSGLISHSTDQSANLPKSLYSNKLQETTSTIKNDNDLCSNDKIICSAYSDSTSHRTLEFCKKPNTSGKMVKQIEVLANFFALEIDYSKSFYQYHVDVIKKITKRNNSCGEVSVNKDKRRLFLINISIV